MKKINIVLLKTETDIQINGLKHATSYIYHKLKACGYTTTLTINRIDADCLNIIFGSHAYPQNYKNFPENIIIFNTEQLHSNSRWSNSDYLRVINENIVWDYTKNNLEFIDHHNKFVVNFLYCSQLTRIKKINKLNTKYDLIFYGLMNKRREKILNTLSSRGIKLKILFGVYDDELDQYISQSRAVLNIHYYEQHFFQSIRAFYPLSNRVPLISENFTPGSAHPIYDDVVFTPEQKPLSDYVSDLLENGRLEKEFPQKYEKYTQAASNIDIELAMKYVNNKKD